MAEVKNYKNESDLPDHFLRFLAGCYVACQSHPELCDQLIWASWSPFQARQWDQHTSPARIRTAIVQHRDLVFEVGADEEKARRLTALTSLVR
jgi:hypothetical protein